MHPFPLEIMRNLISKMIFGRGAGDKETEKLNWEQLWAVRGFRQVVHLLPSPLCEGLTVVVLWMTVVAKPPALEAGGRGQCPQAGALSWDGMRAVHPC